MSTPCPKCLAQLRSSNPGRKDDVLIPYLSQIAANTKCECVSGYTNEALEKKIMKRLAGDKAQRIAAEKAELEKRIEALKAEEKQIAAEKAEEERIAALKAEEERIAALKADEERIAALKADEERIAVLKAEEKRIAAERAQENPTIIVRKAETHSAPCPKCLAQLRKTNPGVKDNVLIPYLSQIAEKSKCECVTGYTETPVQSQPQQTAGSAHPQYSLTSYSSPSGSPNPTPATGGAKLGYGGAEIPELFSCMDDCDACLIGFLAPCVATGRIAEATGDDYKTQVAIYSALGCCCGSCVAGCYHGFFVSKKLHEQYPTPGEEVKPLEYCLCHCCCGSCSKVQELRYLKNLKAKGLLRGPDALPTTGRHGPARQNM